MEKKVIALDLDGTTLNSNGVVPADVKRALDGGEGLKQEIFALSQLQSSRLNAVESMTIVDGGCVAKGYLTTRGHALNAVVSEDGNIWSCSGGSFSISLRTLLR